MRSTKSRDLQIKNIEGDRRRGRGEKILEQPGGSGGGRAIGRCTTRVLRVNENALLCARDCVRLSIYRSFRFAGPFSAMQLYLKILSSNIVPLDLSKLKRKEKRVLSTLRTCKKQLNKVFLLLK